MSRKLLGGGIESAAEWAAVASHENAHARGFLEERDAHMSGLATYLGVTGNLGITADDNLVTEMLFGAIMNDNSANEDGVYHRALTMKEDGTYGWREDGSLDFNINIEELLKKAEEMGIELPSVYTDLSSLDDTIEKNEDGTFTIKYDQMEDAIANKIAEAFMGNSTGNQDFSSFINGTMALKDVSEKAADAITNINKCEQNISGYTETLANTSLMDMCAAMFAAQETDILVKNPIVLEDGLIGSGIDDNPYLPLTGTVRLTCKSGTRFVDQEFFDELKPDSRKNFPLNDYAVNDHLYVDLGSDNDVVVASTNGSLSLDYIRNSWGVAGTVYSDESNGTRAHDSHHLSSNTLMDFLNAWGQSGTSMRQLEKDRYILDGLVAGMRIGTKGQTGISGEPHDDFAHFDGIQTPYKLVRNGKGANFEEIFKNVFDSENFTVTYWAENFSGLDGRNYDQPAVKAYLEEVKRKEAEAEKQRMLAEQRILGMQEVIHESLLKVLEESEGPHSNEFLEMLGLDENEIQKIWKK